MTAPCSQRAARIVASDAVSLAARSLSPAARVLPAPRWRGGFNLLVPVSLSNTRWYARVKLQSFGPRGLHERLMANEVATLGLLSSLAPGLAPRALVPEQIGAPAPSPPLTGGTELLFFVQPVEGRPVHDHPAAFTPAQFARLIHDLAGVYVRLAGRRFTRIGSLLSPAGGVGPLSGPAGTTVRPVFFDAPRGPFRTARERYLAQIDHVLQAIERGWASPDAVGTYVLHLELRGLVERCAEMGEEGPTFLTHGDDRGDHILVRGDGSIAGVIDWELAYTAPLAEAVSPRFLLASSNALSPLEEALCAALAARGHPELAEAIPRGRKYLRLNLLLGAGVHELDGARVWLVQDAFGEARRPPGTLRAWLKEAEARWAQHEGLGRVRQGVDPAAARRARHFLVELERRELARRGSEPKPEPAAVERDDWEPAPPAEVQKLRPAGLLRKLSTRALGRWRGATAAAS
ncbi:hypothetical protein Q8F55_002914 [Vanrija albida]|uniref:Aminoglycoside phosphotransferase domain-containing protein n=1 Tax=Vanrija albida TaxID=181172 RepID=A0ABR3QB19_9TREE